MIDHEAEQLLTLTAAAKLLPGRPNVATLWRWRTAGIRGVKLETFLFGGRRMTLCEGFLVFLTHHRSRRRRADPGRDSPPARAGD